MPELHDVEQFRRLFRAHATGKRVTRVEVLDPEMVRNTTPARLGAALAGRVFAPPERHGKWLSCWTDGPGLVLHFGMTGLLAWSEPVHAHDRLLIHFDRGTLHYRDQRRFGGIWLADSRDSIHAITGDLGPDALGLSRREFGERLAGRHGGIKAVLMDQHAIAGLGNVLSDEVLWQARIHPLRKLEELGAVEVDRLFESMRRVLERWVRDYGVDLPRWLSHARGKPGAPCPRCHRPLATIRAAGRTSLFCPSCQPASIAEVTGASSETAPHRRHAHRRQGGRSGSRADRSATR